MKENAICDAAGALIDRFGAIKDAYCKSALEALDMLDSGEVGDTDWLREHGEIVAEMGAVMRGYDRAFALYEYSTRGFWVEYGKAVILTDLDILLGVLLPGGKEEQRSEWRKQEILCDATDPRITGLLSRELPDRRREQGGSDLDCDELDPQA